MNASVIDIDKRAGAFFSSLTYFTQRFPCLLPVDADIDALHGEFLQYQVEQFPKELTSQRIDTSWHLISQMTDANGVKMFSMLASVVTGILVISTVILTERAFHIVRKNKTEFRPTLSTRVLNALLTQKISMSVYGQVCYKLQYCRHTQKDKNRQQLLR